MRKGSKILGGNGHLPVRPIFKNTKIRAAKDVRFTRRALTPRGIPPHRGSSDSNGQDPR